MNQSIILGNIITSVKYSLYTAETRTAPKDILGGICQPRNVKEAITREQSLHAMTILA